MSIPRLLADPKPAYSFEFFPGKDEVGDELLWDAVRRVERVQPAFVSITYGAGGSTRDRTVHTTERVATETSLLPLGHLTCVAAPVSEVRSVIGQYAAAGVRNILALRGDPPGAVGGEWVRHPDGLDHAEDLIRLIHDLGDFTVGVAAFPDKHPESPSLQHDIDVLVRKSEAGASFAITQTVFDPETYLRLRDSVAQRVDLPISPGLMPILNLRQAARMSELMGAPLPRSVLDRLEPLENSPEELRAEGIAIATEHARRMLDEGAPGVHFITMNRSTATLEVLSNLEPALQVLV